MAAQVTGLCGWWSPGPPEPLLGTPGGLSRGSPHSCKVRTWMPHSCRGCEGTWRNDPAGIIWNLPLFPCVLPPSPPPCQDRGKRGSPTSPCLPEMACASPPAAWRLLPALACCPPATRPSAPLSVFLLLPHHFSKVKKLQGTCMFFTI